MEEDIRLHMSHDYQHRMIRVPGDGACFLHALKASTSILAIRDMPLEELKRQVCASLRNHPVIGEGLLLEDLMPEGYTSIEHYINVMSEPLVRADELFVTATALYFKISIHVYMTATSQWQPAPK